MRRACWIIRTSLWALLLTGYAAAVAAQPIPTHPRELTFDPIEFDPPEASVHRHVMSNGVVVFVVPDHALPLVTVSVLVRTGRYLDPAKKVGLAELTGNQVRAGGTTSLTPAAFDDEAAFLATQISSAIGNTRGQASVSSLTKDLDAALDLFFDMLRNPRFDPDRLDLAKNLVLQRIERRNDRTQTIERREWNRLLRGNDHFTTRLTTKASLEAITRNDLVAFHRRYYHPGVFIVAVSGDVKPETILPKLELHMGDWPTLDAIAHPVPKPTHIPASGLYVVNKPDVNQGRVLIGHVGTTRDNPDRYALTVMNDILGGGGFTSRLMTRIRSDEGLAYSASSRFGLGTYYDGIFRAGFQSRSETVVRAAAIVLEEISRIRSEPVSRAEINNSISSFVETFTRNFSSAASTANLFAGDEYTGRDPSYLSTYREEISNITVDDVLRVAKQYLDPDNLVVLVVGNLSAIEAGDPDHPEYSLERLAGEGITEIHLTNPSSLLGIGAP